MTFPFRVPAMVAPEKGKPISIHAPGGSRLRTRFLSVGLAAFVFVAAQPAPAQPILVEADANFVPFAFGNPVSKKVDLAIFADARDIGGKVAVCGLVFFGDNVTNTLRHAGEAQLTRQVQYSLNGERLNFSADSFRRYKNEAEALAENKAGCVVTRKPWQKAYDKMPIKMRVAGGTTYYRD